MLISTTTSSFRKHGDDKAVVKLLKDTGFDAYDYNLCCEWNEARNYITKDGAKELRAYADQIGILCNQTHAPFSVAIPGNEEYNEKMLATLIEAIEISGILGAKICVVHPCNDYSPEQNAVLYKKLQSVAKANGVMIALENMWNWDWDKNEALPAACSDEDNFSKHLSLLDSDTFCACLDLGHAEMRGLNTNCLKMIERLGKNIKTLHIHDNDLHDDTHDYPFVRNMDFLSTFNALKEAGYDGDVTFEVNLANFPKELMPACASFMLGIGKYLKSLLK